MSDQCIPAAAYRRAPYSSGDVFERYFEHGILPGGFLQAFLANNLYLAITRADRINRSLFLEYYYWLTEFAPSSFWGSRGAMEFCVKSKMKEADAKSMLERLEV